MKSLEGCNVLSKFEEPGEISGAFTLKVSGFSFINNGKETTIFAQITSIRDHLEMWIGVPIDGKLSVNHFNTNDYISDEENAFVKGAFSFLI